MAFMPDIRMGTAASEPRCRCVYLHHGLDPLLGPTAWKDVATIRPLEAGSASCRVLFVVQVPQGDHCPWLLSREARKEGCDSPVLARLILLLRSPVSCVWRLVRLSVAAQAEISETPGPSATGGTKDGVCRRPWYACQGGSLGVSTC